MSDNTTKIVLHIDNETGQVVKAELEDANTGERTEVTGNFENITLKQATPQSQMSWIVGEPSSDE